MKFLDKIALNRLIAIITNFIITILKLFQPQIDKTTQPKTNVFPWLRKTIKNIKERKL